MSLVGTLRFITGHPLNRGRAAAALGTFVRWQVASRLAPGPVVVPFVEDTRLVIGRGMPAATANLYGGLQEFEEMAFVMHCLRRDDSFADVGANVGAYAVLAAAVCGARCYCFEPVPESLDALRTNFAVNGIAERCLVFHTALGRKDGEVAMTTGQGPVNHVLASGERARGSRQVPLRRLDDALGGAPLTILKIDVEGYELEVLRGAAATLGRRSLLAVIAECNGSGRRYGIRDAQVIEFLASAGFAPMRYFPHERRLAASENGSPRGDNILFVRNAEEAGRRVRQAHAVRIHGQLL